MKITCTLLSICCCILFLSTSAKGEPGRTRKGDIGFERTGEKFPFCPMDKKTSKRIKEITAILKQSTISQVKFRVTDPRKEFGRVPSTSSCNYPTQSNLCPTEKVKYGGSYFGSYCIKRSCYPIRV